jgi:acyl-ACP thioesterase
VEGGARDFLALKKTSEKKFSFLFIEQIVIYSQKIAVDSCDDRLCQRSLAAWNQIKIVVHMMMIIILHDECKIWRTCTYMCVCKAI